MSRKVVLIPGDGIGPEVTEAARRCIEATGVDIQWQVCPAGEKALKEQRTPLPDSTIKSLRDIKVGLKGPITTPVASGYRSVNVQLRQTLQLFACVRPARSFAGARCLYPDIDLVVIRENTEDLYAGIEFEVDSYQAKELINKIEALKILKMRKDSSIAIKPISRFASNRIIRYAFTYAVENNRKKVTVVHKANIMKETDGLFLNIARQIAKEYEGTLTYDEAIVDNLAMQLVQKPTNYDVLVLPNLYGDIISDLCAGLIGGLGIAPGANIGEEIALFEPVHGAAPKYTGQNKVNPTATILSGVLMLRHLKEVKAAERLEAAVKEVIREGKEVTYDLKPNRDDTSAASTSVMADAIIKKLSANS